MLIIILSWFVKILLTKGLKDSEKNLTTNNISEKRVVPLTVLAAFFIYFGIAASFYLQ